MPQKARWDRDFGACMDPTIESPVVVYQGDKCGHWTSRSEEQLDGDAVRKERFDKIDIAAGRV